ncbi:hypothetical protein SAMN04487917_104139 [Arthrobacter sp. yr096]|nr:hypothetical protein SAMN04487912_106237 [Arthrobacter sp. cf158]SEJ17909.1 hypothetical protein SAMN04487917_104139 [Arthrobacter sp. yr096]
MGSSIKPFPAFRQANFLSWKRIIELVFVWLNLEADYMWSGAIISGRVL